MAQNVRNTAINNSTSKQFYSFSKDRRFPERSPLNAKVAYETKSQFDLSPTGGAGRPFFHTSTRFDYYRNGKKEEKVPHPSPHQYRIGDTFGPTSSRYNRQYSFGVGRDNMKKLYIDDIKSKGDKSLPGPGKYETAKTFGEKGLNYSMAAILPTEKQTLGKSAKLPGPGSYAFPEVVGRIQGNSIYNTESQYSFGKANDRFAVPTKKVASPAPSQYKPMTNLNQNYNSTFIKNAQTVFGRNNYSIIDQHFNVKRNEVPGPGSYNRFSDFSGNN